MVIWIIGESGSGKSFLARKLFKEFNSKKVKVYWIDGDLFRKKYSRDLGYTTKDRKKNSLRIQKHCKIKEINNDIILCSILSKIKKHQKKIEEFIKNIFKFILKQIKRF